MIELLCTSINMGSNVTPNTLAYYVFDGNLNDGSGNGHNLSLYRGSVNYGTTSKGGKYAHFDQNTWTNYWNYNGFNYDGQNTVSIWVNPQTDFGTSGGPHTIIEMWESSSYSFYRLANTFNFAYTTSDDGYAQSINNWYNIIYVRDGNSSKVYVNGQLVKNGTPSISGRTNQNMRIRINQVADINGTTYSNNSYLSDFIWEKTARSEADVLKYFNWSKKRFL